MTKFVAENRNYLRQYENSYCLVLNAAANVQKNDTIFDALRVIGVLLLIRDVSTKSSFCLSLASTSFSFSFCGIP